MILKGNQRAGGMQLARHLLNEDDNDHVTVHELRGFIANDLGGAFKEALAVSCGTRCKQFLFSLSLSPPETEAVPIGIFEDAINQIETRMGLQDQPRAIVFHEKDGRRHAHCVWSRIDVEKMRAINLPHYKLKLRDVSRALYIDNNWKLPAGLANTEERNPLNFSRAEWQQAKRVDINPRAIKEAFQDCWAMSDGLKAFQNALEARGYYLAQGDRRGFVAVDWRGEVYAVAKWVGIRTKALHARLGEPDDLRSVEKTKSEIANRLSNKLSQFHSEIRQEFTKAREGLKVRRNHLVTRQRQERQALMDSQAERFIGEQRQRQELFRRGIAGVWDWVTGKRAQQRKLNKKALKTCMLRDETERQALIQRHLEERRELQQQMISIRDRLRAERSELISTRDQMQSNDLSGQLQPRLAL